MQLQKLLSNFICCPLQSDSLAFLCLFFAFLCLFFAFDSDFIIFFLCFLGSFNLFILFSLRHLLELWLQDIHNIGLSGFNAATGVFLINCATTFISILLIFHHSSCKTLPYDLHDFLLLTFLFLKLLLKYFVDFSFLSQVRLNNGSHRVWFGHHIVVEVLVTDTIEQ